jgi:ribonuclease-3
METFFISLLSKEDKMKEVSTNRKNQLLLLEKKINYNFNKKYLLNRALTHSSYANQLGLSNLEHNERLEFLGDSVLSLVISEYIFNKYKNKAEGKLTKIRANIVCESSLYDKAKHIKIGDYMLIGKGEELTGGRERVSILADAYEALIAAIYLDGGFEKAKEFVISIFSPSIEENVKSAYTKDYKSTLQEYIQRDSNLIIKYELENEEGPAHNKIFYVKVSINSKVIGNGKGRSKKEAEMHAAKAALEFLGGNQ